MVTNSKTYIALGKGAREEIARIFGVTETYVYMCLFYRKSGGVSDRIRYSAMKKGGVRMLNCPEMETLHDSDGVVRQCFPNGNVIKIYKNTGRVEIIKGGRAVKTFENPNFNRLLAIQQVALTL